VRYHVVVWEVPDRTSVEQIPVIDEEFDSDRDTAGALLAWVLEWHEETDPDVKDRGDADPGRDTAEGEQCRYCTEPCQGCDEQAYSPADAPGMGSRVA